MRTRTRTPDVNNGGQQGRMRTRTRDNNEGEQQGRKRTQQSKRGYRQGLRQTTTTYNQEDKEKDVGCQRQQTMREEQDKEKE